MIITQNEFNNKLTQYFNIDNNNYDTYAGIHTYTYLKNFDIEEKDTYYDIYLDKVINTVTTDAYGVDIGAYNDGEEIEAYHLHLSKLDGQITEVKYNENEILKYLKELFKDAVILDDTNYYYKDMEYYNYMVMPSNKNKINKDLDILRKFLYLKYYPQNEEIIAYEGNKSYPIEINLKDYCKDSLLEIKKMIDDCFHQKFGEDATYEDIYNQHKDEFLEEFEKEYNF